MEVAMKKQVRARVIVSGRVQGVFFRLETKAVADAQGVSGWVKNNVDGTVEAVFEGDEPSVVNVVEWCRHGPPPARVSNLDVVWEGYVGKYRGFAVRY
jgi:acylphosphatase